MYIQCQLDKSSTGRTATIVFYSICLLYVLSTVDVVCDLIEATVILELEVSSNSICSKDIIFYQLCSQLPVHRLFSLKLYKS